MIRIHKLGGERDPIQIHCRGTSEIRPGNRKNMRQSVGGDSTWCDGSHYRSRVKCSQTKLLDRHLLICVRYRDLENVSWS